MEEEHLVGIESGTDGCVGGKVTNTGNELEERWKKDGRFVEEFLPYLLKKR